MSSESDPGSGSELSQPEHVCTTCSRAFFLRGRLQAHERSHLQAKPCECNDCERCFASKYLPLHHQQKLQAASKSDIQRDANSASSEGQCSSDNPPYNNELPQRTSLTGFDSNELRHRASSNSVADSYHSRSSFASNASQASYDKTDVFDQIIQLIHAEFATQIELLRKHSPSSGKAAFSHACRVLRVSCKKCMHELQDFSVFLENNTGISDRARQNEMGFSTEYS